MFRFPTANFAFWFADFVYEAYINVNIESLTSLLRMFAYATELLLKPLEDIAAKYTSLITGSCKELYLIAKEFLTTGTAA